MPIPDYQTLMLPVLRLIADGHQTIPQCVPRLVEEFHLTEEEAETLLPNGKQTMIPNRAHWEMLRARNTFRHAHRYRRPCSMSRFSLGRYSIFEECGYETRETMEDPEALTEQMVENSATP